MNIQGANGVAERTFMGAPRWLTPRHERAHAMKNHLSTIRLLGRILRRCATSQMQAELEWFDDAVLKIAALVDEDLRAGDRRTDTQERAGRSDVDVQALFEAARARLVDRAAYTNVTLVFECAPAKVRGVWAELAEALHNLLSNAIDATPVGGTVSVRTYVTESGEHAWEIHDTGCGMPREVLARIGTRRCTRGKKGGTGLGLAIAAAAIGAHGGVLEVGPGVSGGTCMKVWLPASPALA